MKSKRENFLRLVKNANLEKTENKVSDNRNNPSHQIEMFEGGNEKSILVIYFSDIDSKLFSNAIHNVHPAYIIDMRPNPRFNIDGYSRKLAFSDFDSIGSIYMDYIELTGADDKSKEHLIVAAEKILSEKKQGPVVFIFGKKEQDEIYEKELLVNLPMDKKGWSLAVMPVN